MKKLFLFLFLLTAFTFISKSQTVTAIVTTNGISPIPAFTLSEPAGLIFVDTKLGKHFIFAPDITFSLKDGRLWFSDLWLKYELNLDLAKRWIAIVGIDCPAYIGQSTIDNNGKKISKAENYPTGQFCIKHRIGEKNTVIFDYWYLQAVDMTTGIKGSYISLSFNLVKELKQLSFISNPNVFYLNYSDGTKGFVGSINAILCHNKSGFFISTQGMTPITTDKIKAAWNISLGITKKLF